MPEKLDKNLCHLHELLTRDIVTVPMLSVDKILQVIQSVEVPCEAWLDCLRAALLSESNNNNNPISFDFAPVIIPNAAMTVDLTSSTLFNSTSSSQQSQLNSQNHNIVDQPSLDDSYVTHQLLSFELCLAISIIPIFLAAVEESLNDYRISLNAILAELSQLEWDYSAIQSLEQTFNSLQRENNISALKTAFLVVDTIITNGISSPWHIEQIVNTINTLPELQWMDELNKIIDEQGKVKSVPILLQELARENLSLNITELEQRFRTVMKNYETQTSRWKSSDIRQRQVNNDELHTIAVIVQAAHLHTQYRPRDIQIFSLLLLIENRHHSQGRLAQICTGEGKSIIVAMLAVYLSLPPLNKHVDIITTSEILARRDAEEFTSFYQMFDLTVGHNCYDPPESPNYNVHIVYGTVNHFAGDLLRTEFYLQTEVRAHRPYEAAIVDEVDSMFIDQHQHYTQLASLTPGYKSLNVILRFIFAFFQKFNITEENEFVIRQPHGYVKIDALTFIQDKLKNNKLIRFPAYRQSYINTKLPKWIKGARRALYDLQQDVDYVISKDGRIIVVDYANTGVSHLNMNWSDGVHQFLQLKHNLRMTPERICDSFFSNVTLFKRYQPHLYGVTGTLGGKDARNFIQSVYQIDTVIVPKYVDSMFDTYPSQFGRDRKDWLNKIRVECETIAITNRRAVLIICQTIQDADDVQLSLHSQHPHLNLYLRSDLAEHNKPELVHSGDVIVATNLAGRGTDLKTTTEINNHGGLHVIVTFMPKNSRIEQQAFGRAGRQGQRGSARLIVYNKKSVATLNKIDDIETINRWKQIRDQQETREMNEAIDEVKRIEAKDRLLVRFLDLAHSKKNDLPFNNDVFKPGFSSFRELWASFCDENENIAEQCFPKFATDIQQRLDASIITLKHNVSLENDRLLSVMSQDLKQSRAQYLADLQCEAVSHLIAHPKYFIYAGFHAMCMNELSDKRERALKLYERALQLDDQDFIAHYNTIPCHIANNQSSINRVIRALDETLCLLHLEIETRKLIQIFYDPPTSQDSTTQRKGPVDQTILTELIYLEIVQANLKSSREQLTQFNEDKHEIWCRFEHWPETLACLQGTKFEPLINDIHAEREEWLAEGLMWRYVFIIEQKRCWWKTVFIFVMGIAQIVGGAFLCAVGHYRLGTSMILDGLIDVYRAIETVTQIAIEGLDIAGIDKNIINFAKQLPEWIKNAQAMLGDDLEQMLRQAMPTDIDRFMSLFNEKSLFNGKEKEMFDLFHHHTPSSQHVISNNDQDILSHALTTMDKHVNKLPLTDMFGIVLQNALEHVIKLEQTEIRDLFTTTIKQFNSTGGFDNRTHKLITNILQSSDKFSIFEKTKHQLNANVRQLLGPVIERENQFKNDIDRLTNNHQAIEDYRRIFDALNITFGTASTQRADLQSIIEQQSNSGGRLLKRAMNNFISEVSKQEYGIKSTKAMKLLQEYLNQNIIQPHLENKCERQMDENDIKLVDKFTEAFIYVQKQQGKRQQQ
ncbi:unnamed protein product [Rotaria sordida]|uniref:Protein translocase subunit SecA n=1 Tax=Rotaria sordida TaxID=392033 RepID=A0A815ILB0_9BILA|nr:unnamed protein product [Rotaria sordida]CAF3905400.1 unnamed protein product [Rotaria sordida]